MRCESPLSWETLVAYWAGDLTPDEEETTELHLLGCATCTAQAERVAAVAQGLRASRPALQVIPGERRGPAAPRRRVLHASVGAAALAAAAVIFLIIPRSASDFSVRLAAPLRDAATTEVKPPGSIRNVRLEPETTGAGTNAARVRRIDDGQWLEVRVEAGPPFTVIVSKVDLTPSTYEVQLLSVHDGTEELRGSYRFHVSP
jgi:hypothetical protein